MVQNLIPCVYLYQALTLSSGDLLPQVEHGVLQLRPRHKPVPILGIGYAIKMLIQKNPPSQKL